MAGKKLSKSQTAGIGGPGLGPEDRNAEVDPQPPTPNPQPSASTVNFASVFLLTLVASGLALARVWLLALALGLNLDLMETVAASSLATVISLLPVSVGGIGARDLALVVILGKMGYSTEKAVGLSTFILLLTLVNLVAGYFIWYTRPHKTI
jgi:uncharacterized membrane protein YbhN (UPF0104 family)